MVETILRLGKEFVAKLPRLHTLLLSDDMRYHGGHGRLAVASDPNDQLGILKEWEVGQPGLVRVAFTALFDWKKIEGVWNKGANFVATEVCD